MEPSNCMLVLSSCLLLFLVVARKESVLEKTEDEIEAKSYHYQTLKLSSFHPSSICSPSTNGDKNRGSLEVVHKHGPCSKFSEDMVKPLTVEEMFSHDQSRVDSIKSRLTAITHTEKNNTESSMVTLPAKSGITLGSGNYIVTVGLGTPKKDLSLIFDTGSDLTWTQCQPCAAYCYVQQDPIFEPSSSTTYTNISCTSTDCSRVTSATGNKPGCISSTCVYHNGYGDGSFTEGYFSKDTLTLASDDVIDGFFFGCGQNNQGLFKGVAGLIGLGRDKLSLVLQSADKYGKVFSYCLPSTSSSVGYLTLGSSGIGSNVAYTPLSTSQESFYGLDLEAFYVGGSKLEISPISGMIIDSGTVVSRLPPTTYSALRNAFQAGMTQYPSTPSPVSLFDTCYDLSKYDDIEVPTISMAWAGNVNVEIPVQGILIRVMDQTYCLAFAADSEISIYGNTQQKTLEVVYDVAAGKVGFGPEGCP